MSAAEKLYEWVTRNGRITSRQALAELADRTKIERDLNHSYSPYGYDFLHDADMPGLAAAIGILYGEVKARLEREAAESP